MKTLQANAGVLTNLEVLEFLRARGATSDPMGCLGAVAPSECKVFDHLVNTGACNQTRGAIDEFLKRCEKFKLAKAEKLNIINLRPSNQALIDPIIEYCEKRLTKDEARGIDEVQELVDLVLEVLPPPPAKPDEEMQALEETPTEKLMEEN
ncbi:DNA-directed RNA polymerase III subunit [Musa troglodytarum]|uniref:DNA-directed RNA polymerase III subunit RPC9 n=1 Tax=Musa troglodytarum TaxID=320322 RepID=A0A9E7HYI2_9LILI|nr:DNA-directed RNA polymerase III subunit [Musa troglodytarum]